MALKVLKLDAIRTDGDTQPRVELDMFAVEDYAADLTAGSKFPPLDVFHDGSDYWLADGFHRYHGARKAGLHEFECNVHRGTVEDARWYSLGANKTHGLRRRKDDIQTAIKRALEMRPQAPDGEIADHIGVARTTVLNHRKEMVATCQIDKSSARTGRDGRTIDTSNIGKGKSRVDDPNAWDMPRSMFDDEDGPDNNPGDDQDDDPPVTPPPAVPRQKETITLTEWNDLHPDLQLEGGVIETLAENSQARFNSQDTDNIEWALWSWNPVTGCEHNCPYCYARDIANRFYPQKFEPSIIPSRLKAPQNTQLPEDKIAAALASGTVEGAVRAMGLKNVFTCSMADLFGRWVPRRWIEAVLAEVEAAPQWNFLFLTKFPQRMAEFDFPSNAWVGTTVDCQARVANAEKAFRKIKAGVKWLSCEPLIEPLRFTSLKMFDWIVVGGSSRSTQTPEWHPPRDWVNDLHAAASAAGCRWYEKTNLLYRIREYPGVEATTPTEAPPELRYLPTK